MGKMTNLGYARLDSLVEDQGDEWLHDQLMCRLMEGERPTEIARSFAIPYVVLRGWMEKNCPDAVALAGRARADELEWKATAVVEGAEVETVGLAKLQAEHYMKLAGKLDRAKYGDKDVSGGGGGITVVVERGGVVRIGESQDKGYPVQEIPAIEAEIEGEI
jgi:hypothetical protein